MDNSFGNIGQFSDPNFGGHRFQSSSSDRNMGPGLFSHPPNHTLGQLPFPQSNFPPSMYAPHPPAPPPNQSLFPPQISQSQLPFQQFPDPNLASTSFSQSLNTSVPPPSFPFEQNLTISNIPIHSQEVTPSYSHTQQNSGIIPSPVSNSSVTIDTSNSNIGNALAGVLAFANMPPPPPVSTSPPTLTNDVIDTASIPIPSTSPPRPVSPVHENLQLPKFLDIPRPGSPPKTSTSSNSELSINGQKTEQLEMNENKIESALKSEETENIEQTLEKDSENKEALDVWPVSTFSDDSMDLETTDADEGNDSEFSDKSNQDKKSLLQSKVETNLEATSSSMEDEKLKSKKKPLRSHSITVSMKNSDIHSTKGKENELSITKNPSAVSEPSNEIPGDIVVSSCSLPSPSKDQHPAIVTPPNQLSSLAIPSPPTTSILPMRNFYEVIPPPILFTTPPPSIKSTLPSVDLMAVAPQTESVSDLTKNIVSSGVEKAESKETIVATNELVSIPSPHKHIREENKDPSNVDSPSTSKKVSLPFLSKEAAKKRLKSFSAMSKMTPKEKSKPKKNPLLLEANDEDSLPSLPPPKKKKKEKMSVIEQIKDEELRIKEVLNITNSMSHFSDGYGLSELNSLLDNPEALKKFEERGRDFQEMIKKSVTEEPGFTGEEIHKVSPIKNQEQDVTPVKPMEVSTPEVHKSSKEVNVEPIMRDASVEKAAQPRRIPNSWTELKSSRMSLDGIKKFSRSYRSRSRSGSHGRRRNDRKRSPRQERSSRQDRGSSRRDRSRSVSNKERSYAKQPNLAPFPSLPRQLLSLRLTRYSGSKEYRGGLINYTSSKPHISYSINSSKYSGNYWSRRELKMKNKKNAEVMKIIRRFWDSSSEIPFSEAYTCSRWYNDDYLKESTVPLNVEVKKEYEVENVDSVNDLCRPDKGASTDVDDIGTTEEPNDVPVDVEVSSLNFKKPEECDDNEAEEAHSDGASKDHSGKAEEPHSDEAEEPHSDEGKESHSDEAEEPHSDESGEVYSDQADQSHSAGEADELTNKYSKEFSDEVSTTNAVEHLEFNAEYEAFIDKMEYRPSYDASSGDSLDFNMDLSSREIINFKEKNLNSKSSIENLNHGTEMGEIPVQASSNNVCQDVQSNNDDIQPEMEEPVNYADYGLPSVLPTKKKEIKKLIKDKKVTKKGRKILKKWKKKLKREKKLRKKMKAELKRKRKLEKKMRKRAKRSQFGSANSGNIEIDQDKTTVEKTEIDKVQSFERPVLDALDFKTPPRQMDDVNNLSEKDDALAPCRKKVSVTVTESSRPVEICSSMVDPFIMPENLLNCPLKEEDGALAIPLPGNDSRKANFCDQWDTISTDIPATPSTVLSTATSGCCSSKSKEEVKERVSSPYSPSCPQESDDELCSFSSNIIPVALDSIPMPPVSKLQDDRSTNLSESNVNVSSKFEEEDKKDLTKSSISPAISSTKFQPITFRLGIRQPISIKKPRLRGFDMQDDESEQESKLSSRKVKEIQNEEPKNLDEGLRDSSSPLPKEVSQNMGSSVPQCSEPNEDANEKLNVSSLLSLSSEKEGNTTTDEISTASPVPSLAESSNAVENVDSKNAESSAETTFLTLSEFERKREDKENRKKPYKEDLSSESRANSSRSGSRRDSYSPRRSRDSYSPRHSRDSYSPIGKRERRRDSPVDARRKRTSSRSPPRRMRSPDRHRRRRSRSPVSDRRDRTTRLSNRSRSQKDRRSPSPPSKRSQNKSPSSKRHSSSSDHSSTSKRDIGSGKDSTRSSLVESPSKTDVDIKSDFDNQSSSNLVEKSSDEPNLEFVARPIDSISNHFGQRDKTLSWEWDEIPSYPPDEQINPQISKTGESSPKRLSLDERLRQEHGLEIDNTAKGELQSQQKYQTDYDESRQEEVSGFTIGSDQSQVIRIGNVLQVLPQETVVPSTAGEKTSTGSVQVAHGEPKSSEVLPSTPQKEVEIGGIKINLCVPPPPFSSPTPVPAPVPPPVSSSNSMNYISSLVASSVSKHQSDPSSGKAHSPLFTSSKCADSVISAKDESKKAVESQETVSVAAISNANDTSSISKLLTDLQMQNVIGQSLNTSSNGETPTGVEASASPAQAATAASPGDEGPLTAPLGDLEEFRKLLKERKERKKREREDRREMKRQKALQKKEELDRKALEQAFLEEQMRAEAEAEAANFASSTDEEDEEGILKEAMTEVPELGSPVPDYAPMNSDDENDSSKEDQPDPIPPLPEPPEKGILMCPTLRTNDENKRKSVNFADGVAPGYGTSPSGGEEIHSPPPPPEMHSQVRKKKSQRKKKAKARPIKQFATGNTRLDSPPPPPCGPPEEGIIELYPGCSHYTRIAPSTFVIYTRQSSSTEVGESSFPSTDENVTIPPGMLLHSSVLSGGYAPPAGVPLAGRSAARNIPPSMPMKLPSEMESSASTIDT